jgi:hypothetical protein
LEIIRVGYKASTNPQGSTLYLKLGLNQKNWLQVISSVRIFCFKPNSLIIDLFISLKICLFCLDSKLIMMFALHYVKC